MHSRNEKQNFQRQRSTSEGCSARIDPTSSTVARTYSSSDPSIIAFPSAAAHRSEIHELIHSRARDQHSRFWNRVLTSNAEFERASSRSTSASGQVDSLVCKSRRLDLRIPKQKTQRRNSSKNILQFAMKDVSAVLLYSTEIAHRQFRNVILSSVLRIGRTASRRAAPFSGASERSETPSFLLGRIPSESWNSHPI